MKNYPDEYQTIAKPSEGFYKEKGSKFLAFAFPCASSSVAKEHIDRLRKEHHTAVHVCFAWRFGTSEPYEDRFSDDGEPNNSAGKPIFGQILSAELTNIVIAVVRYYGGTNLGVGGLINAYKTASREALDQAEIEILFVNDHFKATYSFDRTGDIMHLINSAGASIHAHGFENESPTITFSIRQSQSPALQEEFEKYHDIHLSFLKTE